MLDYTGPNQTWANALERAGEALTRVKRFDDRGKWADHRFYGATSSEAPDEYRYVVEVLANVNGVHFRCSCRGGTKGNVCKHAATVLVEIGHLEPLPKVEPTAEPTPLHQPAAKLSVSEINRLLYGEI